VTGWLAWLPQAPSPRGHPRSVNTVLSYVRSARAFCLWAMRHRLLHATPPAHLPLPAADTRPLPLLEAEEWQQLLGACRPPHESGVQAEQATARNRAILWVLFETGMRATELCTLHLCDVDREQREVLVRGKGAKERRFILGHEGWCQLLTYLDGYRPRASVGGEQAESRSDHLFLSERGQSLTKNGIMHVFERLKNRGGITGKQVTASLLRKNFAARYEAIGTACRNCWANREGSDGNKHSLGGTK